MIPGGVASHPIPGRVVRTRSGELVVPGMIPGGVAVDDKSVYTRLPSLFIAGSAYSHQRPRGGERFDGL